MSDSLLLVVQSLVPYPAEQWAALLPNVVRLLPAAFLEDVHGRLGAGAMSRPKRRPRQ